MKNLAKVFGIIALAAVIGLSFAACDDGSTSGGGGSIVSKETLNGKWETDDSANSTFEFTTDSIYIVVGNFGQPTPRAVAGQGYVYTGKYSISGSKITLEGFGVIDVKSFSKEEFNFSLELANSNVSYNFLAVRLEDTIAISTRTNLLCRFWKLTKVSVSEHEYMIGSNVLFSKAGTYLVTYNDGSTALAEWKWKNTEQTILQYSWNQWGDSGEVQIQNLAASSLKILEKVSGKDVIWDLTLGN
jgi:hypothetical protein